MVSVANPLLWLVASNPCDYVNYLAEGNLSDQKLATGLETLGQKQDIFNRLYLLNPLLSHWQTDNMANWQEVYH